MGIRPPVWPTRYLIQFLFGHLLLLGHLKSSFPLRGFPITNQRYDGFFSTKLASPSLLLFVF